MRSDSLPITLTVVLGQHTAFAVLTGVDSEHTYLPLDVLALKPTAGLKVQSSG